MLDGGRDRAALTGPGAMGGAAAAAAAVGGAAAGAGAAQRP